MEDIQTVYRSFFRDLKRYAKGLPILLLALLAYEVLLGLLDRAFVPFGPMGGTSGYLLGFLRWGVRLACLSHFAGLMNQLFTRERLRMEDLKDYDPRYFAPLSQVFFLIYLVDLFSTRLLFNLGFLGLVLTALWEIYTAPAYEAVYLGHEPGGRVLPALVDFWKNNGLTLLPYVLLVAFAQLYLGRLLMLIPGYFSSFPFFILRKTLAMLLLYYSKAILFRILYFSTPRSRAFHSNAGGY